MVNIKNIADKGNTISMDCYREGDLSRCFHLVIDREGNIISGPEKDVYSAQARWKIYKLIQDSAPLPEEIFSYWY